MSFSSLADSEAPNRCVNFTDSYHFTFNHTIYLPTLLGIQGATL